MAEIRYDISQLTNLAFGLTGSLIRYPDANHQAQAPASIDWKGVPEVEITKSEVMSYLGTPVFMPVRFLEGKYKKLNYGRVQTVSSEEWQLPYTTLVDFNRKKIIAKTQVNGYYGEVKEMYGFGDWDIKIRGFLINNNPFKFPEEELRRLLEFENLTDAISVEGDMFNWLSIYKLVIEDIQLPRIEGMPNVQPFQLSCVSDVPIELEEK